MKKSFVSIIILSLLFAIFFVPSATANNTSSYVLYKNDSKFSLPEYPVEEVDSEIYVPTSFLIGFDKILYEYIPLQKSFYFINTETGRYFSYSAKVDNIIVDGTLTQISFPVINSTIYAPLEYCAEILSLQIETYKEKNVTHIRLTDGTQTLDFIELIELFDPAGRLDPPPVDPPEPPVVDLPTIDPPNPPQIQKNKTVHLVIAAGNEESFKQTLDILKGFGETATLLLKDGLADAVPKQIIRALVLKNTLGIYVDESSNDVLETLRDANNSISLISNLSTRIYYKDTVPENIQEIENAGYILWNEPDFAPKENESANDVYEKALEEETCTVFIDADSGNFNFLKALLGLFSNDDTVALSAITPTSQNK